MWHAGKNIPIKFHQDIPYSYLVTWLLDIYQRDVTPKSIYYKSLDQYLTTAMGYRDSRVGVNLDKLWTNI